jgi:hypothetical protein
MREPTKVEEPLARQPPPRPTVLGGNYLVGDAEFRRGAVVGAVSVCLS